MNPKLNILIHIHTLTNGEIDTILKDVKHSDNSGEISINLFALFPKTSDNTLTPTHFVCVSNMACLHGYQDCNGKKHYRHVCNKCKMQFSSDTSEKYLNHIVVGHWVPSQVLLEEHLQKLDYQGKKMKIFSRYYFLFILQ